MNTQEDDEETPIAWTAIIDNTPVELSDGHKVGTVHEVLGAEDIFHGIVVRSGPMGTDKMIPAERVATITDRRIVAAMSDDELRALPPYQAEDVYSLGIVGLFRKHLGWVEGKDEPG